MTISPGSPILAADLNTEQDANRTALQNFLAALYKNWTPQKRVFGLSSATALSARRLELIPSDDWEILVFALDSGGQNIGTTLTATIETPDDIDNTFLLGQPLTISQTVASGTIDVTRTDLTSTSGQRLWLLRGVKYAFTLTSDDAAPPAGSWADVKLACKARARER